MQLIDEKGKIFGRVNVIDLALIIFTILVFLTGYKYLYLENYPENILNKLSEAQKPFWINITVISYLPEVIYNKVKIDDVMKNENVLDQEIVAKILGIDAVEKKTSVYEKKFFIKYALRVTKTPNKINYDERKLEIGSDFSFITKLYSIYGKIVDMQI